MREKSRMWTGQKCFRWSGCREACERAAKMKGGGARRMVMRRVMINGEEREEEKNVKREAGLYYEVDWKHNPEGATRGRREMMTLMASTAALSVTCGGSLASNALSGFSSQEDGQIYASSGSGVLITGATSGIGFDAVLKLLEKGEKVFAMCRSEAKATAFSEAVRKRDLPGTAVPVVTDLSSLSAVRRVVEQMQRMCPNGLGGLVLNAGVQFSGKSGPALRTDDGFEYTIGVNHLSHFLLANLLLPLIIKYTQSGEVDKAASSLGGSARKKGARIVVTASEVHDPTSGGGSVGSPAHLGTLDGIIRDGKDFVMVDESKAVWDADKAYKDSKACNVLFALELSRRLSEMGYSARDISCNCYGPGLITRTNFFRNQNRLFVTLFDLITNTIGAAESVSGGGDWYGLTTL